MATRRVAPRRVTTRSRRPGGTWARFVLEVVTVPVSSKVLLGTFSLSNAGIGETIRRSLGQLYVVSDQASASENQFGAFGIIVANDIALAAGAASIPGPFTDANDDGWLVWQGFSQSLRFGTAVGFEDMGTQYAYDSRAMRRVDEGFGLAVMVENGDAAHVLNVGLTLSQYATRN